MIAYIFLSVFVYLCMIFHPLLRFETEEKQKLEENEFEEELTMGLGSSVIVT